MKGDELEKTNKTSTEMFELGGLGLDALNAENSNGTCFLLSVSVSPVELGGSKFSFQKCSGKKVFKSQLVT